MACGLANETCIYFLQKFRRAFFKLRMLKNKQAALIFNIIAIYFVLFAYN